MLAVRLDGSPGEAEGMDGRVADGAVHREVLQVWDVLGGRSGRFSNRVRGGDVARYRQTDPGHIDSCPLRPSPGVGARRRNPMTLALVWADMHSLPRRLGSRSRALGLTLAAVSIAALAACSSAGASPAGSSLSEPPSSLAPSEDPNSSVGIDLPAASDDPALIDPVGHVVVPKPGQLDVREIPAQTLSAAADGRRVTLTIEYTSGVEPCYVLDSIVVAVGADTKTFDITLREGHGPEDVACIEIAESKRAIVELGELAPGTYKISDTTGGAAPITITVA
jgi:hypothetical protein